MYRCIPSGRGTRSHVPPSPVRRKGHEVPWSPAKRATPHLLGHSPSHHRPLNPANQAVPPTDISSEGGNISPQHHIPGRGAPPDKSPLGVISSPLTPPLMPPLIEEEEKEIRENLPFQLSDLPTKSLPSGSSMNCSTDPVYEPGQVCGKQVETESVAAEGVGGARKEGVGRARGEGVGGVTEEEVGGAREEGVGGVRGEEVGGVREGEGDGRDDLHLGPASSTPASKFSDFMKKSDSFQEYLGSAGGSEFDRYSVTSMASLPEGLFEGFIRHKDGSSIGVVFQVIEILLHLLTMVN